jgi:hypothetical protein
VNVINGIPVRDDLPNAYDSEYKYLGKKLSNAQTNTAAELSIMNPCLLEQLTMPMVLDFKDRDRLVMMFQHFLAAEILAAIDAELITAEFYGRYSDILCPERGIRDGVTLDAHTLFRATYDFERMIHQYIVVMGADGDPGSCCPKPTTHTRTPTGSVHINTSSQKGLIS